MFVKTDLSCFVSETNDFKPNKQENTVGEKDSGGKTATVAALVFSAD